MDPNNMEAGVYGKIAEKQLEVKDWRKKEIAGIEGLKKYSEQENMKILSIKEKQEKMSQLRSDIEKLDILQEEKEQEYKINLKEKDE